MEGSAGATVGDVLRRAREEKKLSIEKVNQLTKISPEVLRALEQDDHGSFASETYLKGFLKSYGGFLGLDGAQLWNMLSRKNTEPADGPYWEVEATLKEEKLKAPRIFGRFVLPLLIIVIIVLVALLIRENRKVKSLTVGNNTHQVHDEVKPFAGQV